MKDYLVIDVETTGATNGTKGNPFCPSNKLCCIGLGAPSGDVQVLPIDYLGEGKNGHHLKQVQERINAAKLVITFTKFDPLWLRRYGIKLNCPYYDLQSAEFILNGQRTVGIGFDSVNDLLASYGLEAKKDIVKEEYWKKGLDTDQVPWEILEEYTAHDVRQEGHLFEEQMARLQEAPHLRRIIFNTGQDELITADMEWNGIQYDVQKSLRIAHDLETEAIKLTNRLYELVPYSFVNWNSPEQVSAVLYGGKIIYEVSESFLFTYKNPKKPPVVKNRKVAKEQTFERLVEPLPNSGLEKDGVYSTGDKTLRKLKAEGKAKEIVSIILDNRGLEKRIGTWYRGFPLKIKEMEWQDDLIHTNLSHCTARTGRLSSTNPNVQNIEDKVRECLITRFPLSSAKTIQKPTSMNSLP